jgi:HSP20 family protein
MNLVRYQEGQPRAWQSLDRWSGLRDELNMLFELPFGPNFEPQTQLFSGWTPALNLYQNNDDVVVVVELPGMRKEEIDISLHDGTLTVSGERKTEAGTADRAERSERYVGSFRRSIALPTRVDSHKVSATYKDGILTITLPKSEEAKPKQIQVNVS